MSKPGVCVLKHMRRAVTQRHANGLVRVFSSWHSSAAKAPANGLQQSSVASSLPGKADGWNPLRANRTFPPGAHRAAHWVDGLGGRKGGAYESVRVCWSGSREPCLGRWLIPALLACESVKLGGGVTKNVPELCQIRDGYLLNLFIKLHLLGRLREGVFLPRDARCVNPSEEIHDVLSPLVSKAPPGVLRGKNQWKAGETRLEGGPGMVRVNRALCSGRLNDHDGETNALFLYNSTLQLHG